jgi:ATP-dependent DNA ligase
LQDIIKAEDGIQVGGYVENRGKDLFRFAREKGLEGIIAKRKSSIYRPGKRSPDWLKIKSRPPKPAQLALYSMHIQPADFGDRRGS